MYHHIKSIMLWLGAPLLILAFKLRLLMFAVLWLGAAGLIFTHYRQGWRWKSEWNMAGFKAGWRPVLFRFVGLAAIIAWLMACFQPENLFSLVRGQPALWILIMVIYPVLSVLPQELVYRSYLYHEYKDIWDKRPGLFPWASAAAFGWMHIIFLNPVAVVMTIIGGYLFGQTYWRYRSLALVCFEHALYGCFVFTIGLGSYFYSAGNWVH